MAKVFRLPRLGKSMKDGMIVASYVKEGDEVGLGDVVFELETDKATFEAESSESGFVRKVLVREGQTVWVDSPLIIIGGKDEEISEDFVDGLIGELNEKQELGSVGLVTGEIEPVSNEELVAAFRTGVAEVQGGGDVSALDEFRLLTGRKALWSKRNIPCFYLSIDVDVTGLLSRCDKNEAGDLEDYVIHSLAVALEHYPLMTGHLEGESIELTENAGIGVAVEVSGAVVSVVIRDVGGKSIEEISQCRSDLVRRVSGGGLEVADIEGACITISNAGVFGVDSYIPIVPEGQCSSLGIGRVKEKWVKSRGEVEARKSVCLSLSIDHRVANGAESAQFLDSVKKLLENAEK